MENANNTEDILHGAKILVVEDEPHLAHGLSFNLEQEHAKVQLAHNGMLAIATVKTFMPDLVVLDLMLPDISGFEVLKKIRGETQKLPVLILSAKNQVQDKVNGFGLGADDYLTKPFHLEEFLCRTRRLLQRAANLSSNNTNDQQSYQNKKIQNNNTYTFGNNQINFNTNLATTPNGNFRLTEQEIRLLNILFENPEKIIPKRQLLLDGWGYRQDVETRTLDIFIARLRKYFEKNSKEPKHFISVRNQGIVFYP
ncbi:MAG: response regulator transcription factor [Oligoflexia bacterium]|nr:response regulator transcription factor [Oligoflexia bacterium]